MAMKNLTVKRACAEAYVCGNTTEFEYNTADAWHSYLGSTAGHLEGWTHSVGSLGAISAFADYSGTVAGTVKATTGAAHGLTTGAIVTITGTTNYNGLFVITVVDNDEFYFTDTWVANDGASNWTEGGYIKCGVGSAGKYVLNWSSSNTAIVNNTILEAIISINEVIQERTRSRRKFGIGADSGNMTGTAMLDITDGDKIIMNVMNIGGTGNSIPRHANINLIKCD